MNEMTTERLKEEVNKCTAEIVSNPGIFRDYLRWGARFMNYKDPTAENSSQGYSISNQILIYSFAPSSRLCYSAEVWDKIGIKVLDDSEPIYVFKKTGEDYISQPVFDISCTNAEPFREIAPKDVGALVEALFLTSPCRVMFDETMGGGRADLSKDGKFIKVGKGFKDMEHVFSVTSTAMCRYMINKEMSFRNKGEVPDPVLPGKLSEASGYGLSKALSLDHFTDVEKLFPKLGENDVWDNVLRNKPDKLYLIRNDLQLVVNAARKLTTDVSTRLADMGNTVVLDNSTLQSEVLQC